jgi:hypothetical protein
VSNLDSFSAILAKRHPYLPEESEEEEKPKPKFRAPPKPAELAPAAVKSEARHNVPPTLLKTGN